MNLGEKGGEGRLGGEGRKEGNVFRDVVYKRKRSFATKINRDRGGHFKQTLWGRNSEMCNWLRGLRALIL